MAIIQYYVGSHGPYFVDDTSDQFIDQGQVVRREELLTGDAALLNKTLISPDVDEIRFNPLLTSTTEVEGVLRWNWAEHCFEYITGVGNVVQSGKEIWDLGVNKTGFTVTDGLCVAASGTQGNRLAFDYGDASTAAGCNFVGVVTAPILNNAEGPITAWGVVNDVNTSAWAEGTKLYLSSDGSGNLTDVSPDFPNFRVWVATVINSHATQGSMFVAPRIDFGNGVTFTSLDIIEFLTSKTAKFGDAYGSNYSEFEDDGTLVAHGDATTYDDVYPSSVNVGVGETAPGWTNYSGNFKAYEFTGGVANKELQIGYQIYHSYEEGTDINPHIHAYIANDGVGGTIIFDIEYWWGNVGDTGAISSTTIQASLTLPADTTIRQNQIIAPATPINGVGKKISSFLGTRLVRRQDLDTFAGSAWLLSADVHIKKNMNGSRSEFTK